MYNVLQIDRKMLNIAIDIQLGNPYIELSYGEHDIETYDKQLLIEYISKQLSAGIDWKRDTIHLVSGSSYNTNEFLKLLIGNARKELKGLEWERL